MRAMVLDAPGRALRAADLPEPEPRPGQLLLRVHACGVCRTDLHLRDDDDDGEDFGRGHGDGSEPEEPCGPGGLRLPLPDAQPWHARRRDRHGDRHGVPVTARREAPHRTPSPLPAKRGPHT